MFDFFKKFFKFLLVFVSGGGTFLILALVYFNWPVAERNENANLGITFSARYASDIGLNWRDAFLAALDDLGARKIRIPLYWDLIESEKGEYRFEDVDWQLGEARKRGAEVILVVGQKVPRWPECHLPDWAKNKNTEEKNQDLLAYMETTVNRYKDNHPEVKYWQVENEPFLPFGICPPLDVKLLDREIALVRRIDPARKIIVTDSGELSLWVRAAKRADIFGTTMYLQVWKEDRKSVHYPVGPKFFHFKYWLIKKISNQTEAIVVELQAEPWIGGYTTNMPLEEQFKSMDAKKLIRNVEFARKVGFPEIYLWGVEWWYWLKIQKNHPEIWETAKNLFNPAPPTRREETPFIWRGF